MTKKYAVTGIGNAIIDILTKVDDNFLEEENMVKSSMTLIDRDRAHQLLDLKHEKIRSGGSVANSIVTLASFNLRTALIGKVGSGRYGKMFSDDLAKVNVDFYCNNRSDYGTTARSFVMITPDGNRTMATYLGEASNISDEINEQVIADSQILYLEGYLWDKDNQTVIDALKKAIRIAKENDTKIAFTLSDSFCVARHRDDFLKLIDDVDILFSNDAEIKSLLSSNEIRLAEVKELTKNNKDIIIAVTRSDKGALIYDGRNSDDFHIVPTSVINQVTDATGAGDCFAAGFLYGINHGYDLVKAAQIGNLFAGVVIEKIGARLDKEEIAKIREILNHKQPKAQLNA